MVLDQYHSLRNRAVIAKKVKFAVKQALKTQKGSTGIALLFL
jgi:hypothetical protein